MEIGIFGNCYGEANIDELLGPELVDQVLWCAEGLAWWNNIVEANWSGDGVKLISSGVSGYIKRNAFWVVGGRYKVVIGVTRVGGTLYGLFSGVTGWNTSLSGLFVYYVSYVNAILAMRSITFNGSVYSLSIKKVLEIG